MSEPSAGTGTNDDAWGLRTLPSQSQYLAYHDATADPLTLVCVVGQTVLGYQLRCLEDLHAMLTEHGDWMARGNANEEKPPPREQSRPGGAHQRTRAAAGTRSRRTLRERFANYVPPVMEHLGLAEFEHNPCNNRMRAR